MGVTFKDFNGGSKGVTESFTATVGGSASISIQGSGSFDISAVIAGAQASVSVTLQATVTVSEGNTGAVWTPSHMYGYGQYGVWEWSTGGSYYWVNSYCGIQSKQYITSKVPEYTSGWKTWVSSR
jgi:hypothetical protein